jgi:archaemetzincin
MASKKNFSLKLLQSIEPVVADDLVAHIETLFNINCTKEYIRADLDFAYTQERGQYSSTAILAYIKKTRLEKERALLAVVNEDIYATGVNFVFGEAEVGGRVAVISLARLRPTYWGEPNSVELLKQRARKEATHELGHVMGLNHCPNTRCVMFFSNTLGDTDKKLDRFCPDCTHLLAEELIK